MYRPPLLCIRVTWGKCDTHLFFINCSIGAITTNNILCVSHFYVLNAMVIIFAPLNLDKKGQNIEIFAIFGNLGYVWFDLHARQLGPCLV